MKIMVKTHLCSLFQRSLPVFWWQPGNVSFGVFPVYTYSVTEESLLGVCRLSHLIGYCFCCSVIQSCPTFCNCMDCTSGLSVHDGLSPWVCSNSCPLSQWCHSTILSSVALFSSCPQCLPASGSFPMSCLFASGHQSIRASASASVLPMNIQGWFPLGLTGLISLLSKGLSRVFSSTTVQKLLFLQ